VALNFLSALLLTAIPSSAQVHFVRHPDRISVQIDGKPFTEIFQGPTTRKPFLHPLRSASGKVVTRRFPMEQVAGEATDHPHHQGLSFTHAEVNGYNFWASDASQIDAKSGSIRLKRILLTRDGKTSGRTDLEYEWLDPSGKPILAERRVLIFRADRSERVVDFDTELTALDKVVFGDTKEGTFNIRIATGLQEDHGGAMVGASGCKGEKECWGTRGNWMDDSGRIDGEDLGIAIFDHPGNPGHPTYWHSRAYGLFSANPFGAEDFRKGRKEPPPARDGSLTVEKGQTARFRYRVLIHPGRTDPAVLEKAYASYTAAAN
jgi:hypothetical protein